MTSSNGDRVSRILADPAFQAVVASRARFCWGLAAAMCVVYFGFIALVAFLPGLLGQPAGEGTLTVGLVVGMLVILAAFALTAIYVLRANAMFDAATRSIVERHQ